MAQKMVTFQVSGFPNSVSVEEAKEFLERWVGKDRIVSLKKRPFKRTGAETVCFIAQFESEKDGESLVDAQDPNGRIWYGPYSLRIRKLEAAINPNPKKYLQKVDMNFGCQIATDKFLILWQGREAWLDVFSQERKLSLIVVHQERKYKVELTYENIGKIQQRCGLTTKYYLIQLQCAPRIFKKVENSSGDYFKYAQDDDYVRTTDFTGSCIGQSSGLCLEIPSSCSVSYFKSFPHYKEEKEPFTLEHGSSFCAEGDLVPVIVPVGGIDLLFAVFYKINMLVQNGCIPGPTLGTTFFQLLDHQKVDIACIEYSLEKLLYLKECSFDPVSCLTKYYREYNTSKKPRPSISLDGGLVNIRTVKVTPCKVYFCGPEVNVSNRVLRMFPDDLDNFIRVSFVDEDLGRLYSTDLAPRVSCGAEGRQTAIYHRIVSTLENGIVIGDKHFQVLAFSSSQLRETCVWMFSARPGLSAAQIRERLGDFSQIRNVAKYAARLGQSLSSSTETLTVERHEMEMIPDVETGFEPNKYIFSDGIGKISSEFAKKVARKCAQESYLPCAFQIRYGGCKGVVAVDPTSTMKLSLRKSMLKYESVETKLDVLAYSKYQPSFLNRQLITLLSTLGVKDDSFERKQKEAVDQLDAMLSDPLSAHEALDQMSPGENSCMLKLMIDCGYKPNAEPYLSMMLNAFRSTKLLELRTRSRIFIPKGRSLMGCMDETRTLEYGQVFLRVSSSTSLSVFYARDVRVIEAQVIVAKNPCLHPGDIRVLWAVDVPELHHMIDCVVFPQKGKRPHPNECSGSDLDGDIYFVSWDPDLIPSEMVEPMDYTPPSAKVLDHEVKIKVNKITNVKQISFLHFLVQEVEEYFANYIGNDNLGVIANAHTVFADKELKKALSDQCLELAILFSVAVDFNKTGVPAVIPRHLYVHEYPDFMEKADKETYISPNILGKLFRQVKDPKTDGISGEVAQSYYDPEMQYPGFNDHLQEALYYKGQYDQKLRNVMHHYGIETEAEILSSDLIMSRKNVHLAVRALRKEARAWLNEEGSTSGNNCDVMYAKASAWYHVTYHEIPTGPYLISFPWCVHETLIQIKRMNMIRAKERLQARYQTGP